jgi:hypothetical protein
VPTDIILEYVTARADNRRDKSWPKLIQKFKKTSSVPNPRISFFDSIMFTGETGKIAIGIDACSLFPSCSDVSVAQPYTDPLFATMADAASGKNGNRSTKDATSLNTGA